MKIKRNTLTMVLVLVLGLTLFTAATVAASSTNVGYETFKETMKDINHYQVTNAKVNVTLTDNGETLLNLNAEGIGNKNDENFSANVNIAHGDDSKSLEVYGQDGTVYIIDVLENDYFQMLHDEEMDMEYEDFDGKDHSMTSVEEELLDHFVGDLKDNFIVNTKADGSKTMTFNMEANEVPTGLNLLIKAASAAEHRSEDYREDSMDDMPFFSDFDHESKPELTEDVQLDKIALSIDVDADNNITGFTADVEFSGKDAEGTYHEVAMSVNATLGYEDVTPETIDVDAYDWELVEHEEYEGKGRKGHR